MKIMIDGQMRDVEFDWENWEPSRYTVNIELGGNPGDDALESVTTRERPFIIEQIQHVVVGDNGDDDEAYSLDWSIQNDKRYWKGSTAPMATTYGSTHHGRWQKESVPVGIEAKTTLFSRLVNYYQAAGEPRNIQVLFVGMERKKALPEGQQAFQ